MNVEEEYEYVLQNIESPLNKVYDDPEMTDSHALNAINGLIRTYNAEKKKRNAPKLKLSPLAETAFEQTWPICDFMVGNTKFSPSSEFGTWTLQVSDPDEMEFILISHDVLIACLKRVEKSIKRWSKQGGRRGYHDFVKEFLP